MGKHKRREKEGKGRVRKGKLKGLKRGTKKKERPGEDGGEVVGRKWREKTERWSGRKGKEEWGRKEYGKLIEYMG